MRRLALSVIIALAICVPAAQLSAASWDAFKTASFTGIELTPSFAGTQTSYTLTFGPNPQVTIGSNTYDINWCQGVYAFGKTEAVSFTATQGTDSAGWSWDAKSNPGQIAGYKGTGGERIHVDETVTFTFGQFSAGPGQVLMGFHLGYQVGSIEDTDWFYENAVPEPSSLAALLGPLTGMLIVRRRK